MIVRYEFCCPRCRSSHFGTDLRDNTGMCNDCRYQWHRRDDWKVFVKIHQAESPAEYEREVEEPLEGRHAYGCPRDDDA